jgi:hypothetical protein
MKAWGNRPRLGYSTDFNRALKERTKFAVVDLSAPSALAYLSCLTVPGAPLRSAPGFYIARLRRLTRRPPQAVLTSWTC